MSMKLCIVGAGMAGLACAEALSKAQMDVILFDKGRGPGGRMATRRLATALGEVSFDHGAQYLSASSPGFQSQLEVWSKQGLVVRWPPAGTEAWVGCPSMNAPLKAMAQAFDVQWGVRVETLSPLASGWKVQTDDGRLHETDAVVLAVPAEQAAVLLTPQAAALSARASTVVSDPCWTVMLAFDRPVPFEPDIIRGGETHPVSWAARNSSKLKRGSIETWVIQAGSEWSKRHLDHPAAFIEQALMEAFASLTGCRLSPPIACSSHRWLYAHARQPGVGPMWDKARSLGLCGDWLVGSRVEDAWLSGKQLADMILDD
jgi:predicted NAD/FAD-dependent oxidoreductase